MKTISFLLLALFVSCGKIEQVQDSFIAMSGNNDLIQVEIRIGSIYINNSSTNPNGYNYINFENSQYRIGSMTPDVQTFVSSLPKGQEVPIYFKGQFQRRSGISSANPSVVFDVIDLEAASKK